VQAVTFLFPALLFFLSFSKKEPANRDLEQSNPKKEKNSTRMRVTTI
jgi:hypothetical protein